MQKVTYGAKNIFGRSRPAGVYLRRVEGTSAAMA